MFSFRGDRSFQSDVLLMASVSLRLFVLPLFDDFCARIRSTDSLESFMTDPRNIAHDKKVHQEKKHHGEEVAPGSEQTRTPQPGKKTPMEHHASDDPKVPDEAAPEPTEEKPLK